MAARRSFRAGIPAGVLLAAAFPAVIAGAGQRPEPPKAGLRAVLAAPERVDQAWLAAQKQAGRNAVAIRLEEGGEEAARIAARLTQEAGLERYYWIDVGRSRRVADAHPEWMASLQGHSEWRRFYPGLPQPAANEVVKNYPWVPVRSREAFAGHRKRVSALLAAMEPARGVFLNHLQAGPSACGCGNAFCRWTPDYGPLRTNTELGPEAAAEFCAEVERSARGAAAIPVWTTECEEHEMAKDAACAGVPCYRGRCWFAWEQQFAPVRERFPVVGVLACYRSMGREQRRYGGEAAWVGRAVAMLREMPPGRKGDGVKPGRVLAVIQGWDVTPQQEAAQIEQVRRSGARGYVLAASALDQSWKPRLHRIPEAAR